MHVHVHLFYESLLADRISDPDHENASRRVSTAIPTTKTLPGACRLLRVTVKTVGGGCRELSATVASVVRAWDEVPLTDETLLRDKKDVVATGCCIAAGIGYPFFLSMTVGIVFFRGDFGIGF